MTQSLNLTELGLVSGHNPSASFGKVYWVESYQGSDGNDGLSPSRPKKTISAALAASHAAIAASGKGYCRNTIYIQGSTYDSGFTENLTKLAQKTDIVGVGSGDAQAYPRIDGTHTIEAATTATYLGCRFFNVEFYGSSAAPIMTVPANQNGLGFYNCIFTSTDAATIGLRVTSVHDLTVEGCRFNPSAAGAGFVNAALQVQAGSITNVTIKNNIIHLGDSGDVGIDWNCTAGQADNCWAIGNNICSNGQTIDDEGSDLIVVNNNLICLGAAEGTGSSWTFNVASAANNVSTGNNQSNAVPDLVNLGS